MVSRIPSPLPCLRCSMWAALCACTAQRPGRSESVGKCSQPAQHLLSWACQRLQNEFVQLRHTCKPPRCKAVSPRKSSLWADTCHFRHHKAFKWNYVWQEEQKCGKPKLRCINKLITSHCGITTVFFFCREQIWQHQMPTRHSDSVSYFKPICCCPKPQDEQRFVSSFCNYFFEYVTFPCAYKLVHLTALKDVEGNCVEDCGTALVGGVA